MNPTTHRAPTRVLGALGLATGLALAAAACSATEPSPAADGATGSAVPHGFVEGASESREPQLRLLAVSATGETVLHDLLTAETTTLDPIDAPDHSATDGRFLVTSDAERTTVVDGGAWTVDHGDHTHYYAAKPRVVGTLDGGGPVEVHSSETTTTITWPERGEAVALDRDALGQGDVEQRAAVDASVLLPFGEHLVQASDDGVRVLDGDGRAASGTAPQACTEPTGGIVTRAGAVVGCADGAVVVDDDGGTTFVELPDGAERPTAFAARSGRPTVAGVAGTTGAWLLDARDRSWRYLATERPLRTVVAVDDADEHVVGVDDQGRVVVLTAATGAVATTEPLIGAGAGAGAVPLLQLDAQRAYVADPEDGVVHEIDFADGARVARTIELPIAPAAFAEVGL